MKQMFKKKDYITGILLSLFIIILSILLITFIPIIYRLNIKSYDLNTITSLTNKQLIESLETICKYLMIFSKEPLVVPHFTLTKNTLIHFKDVKLIYTFMQIFLFVDLIILIYRIRKHIKDREVQFLKVSMLVTVIILIIASLLGLSDFSSAFILMHQILFRNNYWLIDPMVDPVINIFPEIFFNHCLIGILCLILLFNIIVYIFYFYGKKKFLK